MDALVRKTSPLDERIRKPDTLWVEPRYEADVAFADMTEDGLRPVEIHREFITAAARRMFAAKL